MDKKKKFVVSYTALVNGIINNAGCFEYADDTAEAASANMVKDYEDALAEIKDLSLYPEKIDADITEDTIDGKMLPALCVIREFNGIDNDILTWTVSSVYV